MARHGKMIEGYGQATGHPCEVEVDGAGEHEGPCASPGIPASMRKRERWHNREADPAAKQAEATLASFQKEVTPPKMNPSFAGQPPSLAQYAGYPPYVLQSRRAEAAQQQAQQPVSAPPSSAGVSPDRVEEIVREIAAPAVAEVTNVMVAAAQQALFPPIEVTVEPEGLGWYVLVRGENGQWEADWSGVLHETEEEANADAAEAREQGWTAAVCKMVPTMVLSTEAVPG